MKKAKALDTAVVFALLVVSVVMFSGIARAGAVPEGFMGIPWGAGRDQIIKTMSEQGYEQHTSERSNQVHFKGDFAGVHCLHLYFDLDANSFHSGSAWGCAWSSNHRYTQEVFERMANRLSEKYGPPRTRGVGRIEANDARQPAECKGSGHPIGGAGWNFVDGRSDEYSIGITITNSSYYDPRENVTPCRVEIDIRYVADSLKKRLEKEGY